jgi:hypothetical protein
MSPNNPSERVCGRLQSGVKALGTIKTIERNLKEVAYRRKWLQRVSDLTSENRDHVS